LRLSFLWFFVWNFVIFEEKLLYGRYSNSKNKTCHNDTHVAVIEAVDKALQQVQHADNETIGSKPNGTPLTRQDLKEGIAISEQQIKEGKYSTVEELAKKWDIEL